MIGRFQAGAGLHRFQEFGGKRAVLQEEIVQPLILVLVGVEKKWPASVAEDHIVQVTPAGHAAVQVQAVARDVAFVKKRFSPAEPIAAGVVDQVSSDDCSPSVSVADVHSRPVRCHSHGIEDVIEFDPVVPAERASQPKPAVESISV